MHKVAASVLRNWTPYLAGKGASFASRKLARWSMNPLPAAQVGNLDVNYWLGPGSHR
jgi:hypothetical protein